MQKINLLKKCLKLKQNAFKMSKRTTGLQLPNSLGTWSNLQEPFTFFPPVSMYLYDLRGLIPSLEHSKMYRGVLREFLSVSYRC